MFMIYAKRNSKGNEIGFLEGVTQVQVINQQTQQPEILPVLAISWCSFNPSTGEVSTTHNNRPSFSFESPSDVVCLGSEMTFFARFDMYADDDGDYEDDEDDAELADQGELNV